MSMATLLDGLELAISQPFPFCFFLKKFLMWLKNENYTANLACRVCRLLRPRFAVDHDWVPAGSFSGVVSTKGTIMCAS